VMLLVHTKMTCIAIAVGQRFNIHPSLKLLSEQIDNSNSFQGKPYPIFSADLGFEMGDKSMNNAAKVLRLLYIQDLRQLQTAINECIAVTQTVTANPKTDSRLGKVGY